jgi:hypothetical protein
LSACREVKAAKVETYCTHSVTLKEKTAGRKKQQEKLACHISFSKSSKGLDILTEDRLLFSKSSKGLDILTEDRLLPSAHSSQSTLVIYVILHTDAKHLSCRPNAMK